MPIEENIEKPVPEEIEQVKKPKKFNTKVIILGLPLFIIQLILVYFITANLLISKITKASSPEADEKKDLKVTQDQEITSTLDLGKFIFLIEDIIVNPADTEGKRLLLTSIGFDVAEESLLADFKSKEVLLKDVIVSTLSSKSLNQLSQVTFKDSIKSEIHSRVKTLLPQSKLNKVYISKYIIQ